MAQGSGSYYNDYMRSNAMLKHCGDKNATRLLTDRNAYISFLEVQLERVSAACLTSQTFEKRLAELESAQNATDQKLGSLSKVFRLNQEYVEHMSQQARSELAGLAAKSDSWMNKFSTESEWQQPRMAALEKKMQQCQEYLPHLVETNDAALKVVKVQVQQEIEGLKAQMAAIVEDTHSSHVASEQKLEALTDMTMHKLDKVALAHSLMSGERFQLERKVTQLGNNVEQLVHQGNASLRAEASETADRYKVQIVELQQRLKQLQNKLEHGHVKIESVLKKCLDSQHLLSGIVVALQTEVDEVKTDEVAAMLIAVKDLFKRQNTLKEALKLLQVCALEAQQTCEDRSSDLAKRLAAAEESFDSRIDDLRKRMLTALNNIGHTLHEDANVTTRITQLQTAQKKTGSELVMDT